MPRLGLCNLHSSGLHAAGFYEVLMVERGRRREKALFLLSASASTHQAATQALEHQLWDVPQGIQVPALTTPSGQTPATAALL